MHILNKTRRDAISFLTDIKVLLPALLLKSIHTASLNAILCIAATILLRLITGAEITILLFIWLSQRLLSGSKYEHSLGFMIGSSYSMMSVQT